MVLSHELLGAGQRAAYVHATGAAEVVRDQQP